MDSGVVSSICLDIGREVTDCQAQSPRATALARAFGLDRVAERRWMAVAPFRLVIEPGQVIYVTGPSGAGKSLCLQAIKAALGREEAWRHGVIDMEERLDEPAAPLIDLMGDLPAGEIVACLNLAGLSEPRVWLRPFGQLSKGEQYRGRLARAVSRQGRCIVADEFCSPLDALTAAGICERVRKWADRTGTTFILAGSRIELIDDLQPDRVIMRYLGGQADMYCPRRPECPG